MAKSNHHPATLDAQALGWTDQSTGAVIMPIHTATTFIRDPDNQYRRGRSYGRADNPTYDQAEQLLTALEGGAGSLLFPSGMAAATAVFSALPPGSHVVAPQIMYWALRRLARQCQPAAVDFVEASSLDAIAAATSPGRTRLVWVETSRQPVVVDHRHDAGTAEIVRIAPARSSPSTARSRRRS